MLRRTIDKAKRIAQESPDLDIRAYSDLTFRGACENGHLDVARWLVDYATSIESPIDIHAYKDFAFRWACMNGHLEVVRWLIDYATSIESHVDIHAQEDYAFRWAWRNGHLELARWLIPFGGMPIQSLPKDHPIRKFYLNRFPTIALLSLYFRRFLYDFRERFYCPGGKGYEAAKKDFEKWTQLT